MQETKLKYQIKATTPLGTFLSEIKEMSQKEIDHLESFIQIKLNYFSFKDLNGNTLIFKENIISSSIFSIIKCE